MASASPSATETTAPDEWQPLPVYAAALYARPGVAAACLTLQDELGADVNLLLSACWLAARGRHLEPPEAEVLRVLAAAWQEPVLAPLRAARRAMKPLLAGLEGSPEAARAASLRHELAALELELEQLVERLLDTAARGCGRAAPVGPDTARANLGLLCGPEVARTALADAIVAQAFPATDQGFTKP